jgi:DNA recombination protein RmuC
MNSFLLNTIVLLVGGIGGALASAGLLWFLLARPKIQALEKANLQIVELRKDLEIATEKHRWLSDAEETLRDTFQSLASDSLNANAESIAQRSESTLKLIMEPLQKNLDNLETHVRELEQKRVGAYDSLKEHLRQLETTQKDLHTTTTRLTEAMKSSRARGRWGEFQLRRLVELAGMTEHVDFEEQVGGVGGRPDMVILMPNGGSLPLDAKTPMNAYLEAVEAQDEKTRMDKLRDHVRAIKDRVRELKGKEYWTQFDPAPPFVVMFVPYESGMVAAYERDAELLEFALQSQVLITTPVTLLALLKSVAFGWQQVAIMENARQIAEEGKTLYERIGKFAEHLASVGQNLQSATDAYNSAVGSMELRLLPSARRFQDLGVECSSLEEPQAITTPVRSLTARELLGSTAASTE